MQRVLDRAITRCAADCSTCIRWARTNYRIELFDDVIDTIRGFDPETQRSSHPVESVRLLPAREFPLDEASIKRVREILRERFDIDTRRSGLYQDLKEGGTPAGIEYYLPLFFESTASLFDYVADDTLIVLGEDTLDAGETFWTQIGERWDSVVTISNAIRRRTNLSAARCVARTTLATNA